MTPCEEKGYKVGDEFVVVEHYPFNVGDRVRLIEDDGTPVPKFKGVGCVAIDGDDWHYSFLSRVRPIATMAADPITTLKQARTTRDEAEAAYQAALEEARECLGEGFMLAEVGVDWAAPDEDMADPANWREGDVVKCVYPNYQGYKVGGLYEVFAPLNKGKIGVIGDLEDQQEMRDAKNFRFHHRPN